VTEVLPIVMSSDGTRIPIVASEIAKSGRATMRATGGVGGTGSMDAREWEGVQPQVT